jgi:F-type H+-transporting ATPase subunit delta
MRAEALADRYGKAVFSLAKEKAAVAAVGAELSVLAAAFAGDDTLERFATSPTIRAEEKKSTLEAALAGLQLSQLVKDFVFVLASRDRLKILKEVSSRFQHHADRDQGIARGSVQTPFHIPDDQKTKLTKLLTDLCGQKVETEFSVNKQLIGGVRARVGSLTIEDSVASHLRVLRETII